MDLCVRGGAGRGMPIPLLVSGLIGTVSVMRGGGGGGPPTTTSDTTSTQGRVRSKKLRGVGPTDYVCKDQQLYGCPGPRFSFHFVLLGFLCFKLFFSFLTHLHTGFQSGVLEGAEMLRVGNPAKVARTVSPNPGKPPLNAAV